MQATLYHLVAAICTIALTSHQANSPSVPLPFVSKSRLPLPPSSITPLEVRSASVSTPSVPTIRLTGAINNTTSALFLTDSGATALFMDTDMARRCKLELKPSTRTVKLADGSIKTATGTVNATCALQTELNSPPLEFEAEFCVTDLQGYDAILGMPWLSHFNPAIDWSSGRLIIHRTEGPISLKRYQAPANEERIEEEVAAIKPLECSSISYSRMARMIREGQVDYDSIELMRIRPAGAQPLMSSRASGALSCCRCRAAVTRRSSDASTVEEVQHLLPSELPAGLPPNDPLSTRLSSQVTQSLMHHPYVDTALLRTRRFVNKSLS